MGLQFSDRLNLLFRAFLKPPDSSGRRREWSNGEVAQATAQIDGGQALTRQYLHMLRTGERGNPSLETAYAIARAFEYLSRSDPRPGQASAVIAYLATDPTHASPDQVAQVQAIDQQLRQAIEIRDNRLIGLVTRLGTLEDPRSLESIRALVDHLEREELLHRRSLRAHRRGRRATDT